MSSNSPQDWELDGEGLEVRLNVRVPRALQLKLNQYIPPGIKSEVIRLVLESLVQDFESRGRIVIGEILAGRYKIDLSREGEVIVTRR